jgi:hypothetical protein
MKSITLLVTAVSLALGAGQAVARSAANMKKMSTSADVAALIANAKRERKSDQPTFRQPILKFSPYTASLEYRAAVGSAIHET